MKLLKRVNKLLVKSNYLQITNRDADMIIRNIERLHKRPTDQDIEIEIYYFYNN